MKLREYLEKHCLAGYSGILLQFLFSNFWAGVSCKPRSFWFCIAKASLEFVILLPLPSKCWDQCCIPLCMTLLLFIKECIGHFLFDISSPLFSQESECKAYNPRPFCKTYTMDKQPLNTGEQKDMTEFFTDLITKVEEMSPELVSTRILKDLFKVYTNLNFNHWRWFVLF